MKNFCAFLLLLLCLACKEERPERNSDIPANTSKGVFISNEGVFQWGNASVTFYDPISGKSGSDDLFEDRNDRPLGDVCQSMTFYKQKAYIVVNNSSKIEVVDAADFHSTGTITGLPTPRYMLPLSDSKAYVTDIYANAIQVVNLLSNTVVKQVPLRGWTEELLLHNGKVFVTNLRTNYLYRIDPQSDVVEDSIFLGLPSSAIVKDRHNKLWVLCSQLLVANSPSRLCRLTAAGDSVEKIFELGTGVGKVLRINAAGDHLYWLKNHVYRMQVTDGTLPVQPWITKLSGENFYTLGVDPLNEDIYTGDAVDYVQSGNIKRHNKDGVLRTSFKAGISPGNFYFR